MGLGTGCFRPKSHRVAAAKALSLWCPGWPCPFCVSSSGSRIRVDNPPEWRSSGVLLRWDQSHHSESTVCGRGRSMFPGSTRRILPSSNAAYGILRAWHQIFHLGGERRVGLHGRIQRCICSVEVNAFSFLPHGRIQSCLESRTVHLRGGRLWDRPNEIKIARNWHPVCGGWWF